MGKLSAMPEQPGHRIVSKEAQDKGLNPPNRKVNCSYNSPYPSECSYTKLLIKGGLPSIVLYHKECRNCCSTLWKPNSRADSIYQTEPMTQGEETSAELKRLSSHEQQGINQSMTGNLGDF